MPIALLLQNPFVRLPTLLAAAKALTPWIDLTRVESVVLERIRGAFMTGWFGRAFPRQGGYALIAIGNRAELNAQLAATLIGPPTTGAASTTNPAAAVAGFVAGIWLSPTGLVMGLWRILRHGQAGVIAVAMAVAGLALWVGAIFAGPAVVAGVAAAAGATAGSLTVTLLYDQLVALLRVATTTTRVMRASRSLLTQLAGPREALRNPLLRDLLTFGDRLAGLGTQLLGATVFVTAYLTPRIVPTAVILVTIRQSVDLTLEGLSAAADTVRSQVDRLTTGELSLSRLMTTFGDRTRQAAMGAWAAISDALDLAKNTVRLGFDTISVHLGLYLDDVERYLARLFSDHPTSIRMKALAAKAASLKAPPSSAPAEPHTSLSDAILGPVPVVPDFAGIWSQFTAPALPPLTADAINQSAAQEFSRDLRSPINNWPNSLRASLTLLGLADRPSVFGPDRAAEQKALQDNRAALGEATDTIATLIRDRLTPALWRRYEPQLADHVDAFMSFVYPLPVKRADQPISVQPNIRRLRIIAPTAPQNEIRALRDNIRARIMAQNYAVEPARSGR